ncbi:MAG: hypothetical protein J3R72DRAFT_458927 [Linnemannia gamsii]|nr:MAG: hypothetical protein J3R72DRAFT_458927 [Linnemannia gamsii]
MFLSFFALFFLLSYYLLLLFMLDCKQHRSTCSLDPIALLRGSPLPPRMLLFASCVIAHWTCAVVDVVVDNMICCGYNCCSCSCCCCYYCC